MSDLLGGLVPGPLTVVRLSEVAGLKRWKLTHQHTDLMHMFQTAAGTIRIGEGVSRHDALSASLEAERAKSKALTKEIRRLESVLERYAIVVSELSFELSELQLRTAEGSNVTDIHPFRR